MNTNRKCIGLYPTKDEAKALDELSVGDIIYGRALPGQEPKEFKLIEIGPDRKRFTLYGDGRPIDITTRHIGFGKSFAFKTYVDRDEDREQFIKERRAEIRELKKRTLEFQREIAFAEAEIRKALNYSA